jgi:hypothetical protein
METKTGFSSSNRYRNHLGAFLIVVESGITIGAEEVRAEFFDGGISHLAMHPTNFLD